MRMASVLARASGRHRARPAAVAQACFERLLQRAAAALNNIVLHGRQGATACQTAVGSRNRRSPPAPHRPAGARDRAARGQRARWSARSTGRPTVVLAYPVPGPRIRRTSVGVLGIEPQPARARDACSRICRCPSGSVVTLTDRERPRPGAQPRQRAVHRRSVRTAPREPTRRAAHRVLQPDVDGVERFHGNAVDRSRAVAAERRHSAQRSVAPRVGAARGGATSSSLVGMALRHRLPVRCGCRAAVSRRLDAAQTTRPGGSPTAICRRPR